MIFEKQRSVQEWRLFISNRFKDINRKFHCQYEGNRNKGSERQEKTFLKFIAATSSVALT